MRRLSEEGVLRVLEIVNRKGYIFACELGGMDFGPSMEFLASCLEDETLAVNRIEERKFYMEVL